jgi:hypothetical protein
VQSIWRTAKKCVAQGIPVDVRNKRRNACGRKKAIIDLSRVRTIALNKRSTIRDLAQELQVKKSTLHNRFKDGQLRRHSNTLKPLLKDSNKLQRLQYCVSMIQPQHRGQTIWIQQDNARTHVAATDAEFLAAVALTGLDIRIMNQPPNSPDMNVLDLGFFSSLQSKTYLKTAANIDELVTNVQEEFNLYVHDKLTKVYLTLQSCLIEVMKQRGGNGYKIPHTNKDGLQAAGILPTSLTCALDVYNSAISKIAEYEQQN